MATSPITDLVGRVLGDRYRLTRPIGQGVSARVYAAEDVRLRRRVAVKVLHPGLAGDETFLRRFRREAEAVAGLQHPHILRVYDWGDDGGSPYLVMELLEGGTLRSMLDAGARLSPGQAAAVGAAVSGALDYAHRRGLVHRDIKPANLIFDDEGRVTVADFGLARALAEASLTEPRGAVLGTARYASPELARGEHLDDKADVYSLAVVLVEAVTGTVPFARDTTEGTLQARRDRDLPVPEGCGPVQPALERAGRLDAAERLDAAGLAAALTEVGRRLPPPAPFPLAPPVGPRVERDEVSPTEHPGRTRLFDADAPYHDDGGHEDGDAHDDPEAAEAAQGGTWIAPAAVGPDRTDRTDPTDRTGGRRPGRRLVRAVVAAALLAAVAAGGTLGWLELSGALTPKHAVPDLVGDSQSTARAALQRLHLGLTVTGTVYSSRYQAGEVVRQAPVSGKLREGSAVTVTLSAGPQPVQVPKLQGDTQEAAGQVLAALGLKVGQVQSQSSMTVGAGLVISNSPDTGTLLPGQPVDLVVSTGKPQVAVPALTAADGASYSSAAQALQAVGLGATETQDYSDSVAAGQVIGFSPGSGTTVTVGTVVTVDVSMGPHLVTVPAVEQMSVGAASQAVTAAGLTVSGVNGNPLSTVVGTSPGPGSRVHIGSAVQLITG